MGKFSIHFFSRAVVSACRCLLGGVGSKMLTLPSGKNSSSPCLRPRNINTHQIKRALLAPVSIVLGESARAQILLTVVQRISVYVVNYSTYAKDSVRHVEGVLLSFFVDRASGMKRFLRTAAMRIPVTLREMVKVLSIDNCNLTLRERDESVRLIERLNNWNAFWALLGHRSSFKGLLLFSRILALAYLIFLLIPGTIRAQAVPGNVACWTNAGGLGPCANTLQPTYLQTTPAASTASTAKTVTFTFPGVTGRGDTILASCGGSNYASTNWTATITDSQGNTYTNDALVDQSTTQFALIARAQNTLGGTKDALTLTVAGSNSANESLACIGYDIPFVLEPKSALDQSNTANNSGSTSPSAGSVTPTGSFELAITAIAAGATSTPTITPGAGWYPDSGAALSSPVTPNCQVAPASGSLTFCSESQPVSTTPGAMTGNATLSVSNAWAAAIAVYGVGKTSVRVDGYGVAGTPAGGVVSVQGVGSMTPIAVSPTTSANSSTNTFFFQLGDGTNLMGLMTNFGTTPGAVKALNVNSSCFIGTTACATATTGVQLNGVEGHAGGVFDAATNATPPANGIQTVYTAASALPTAVTVTDTVAPMADKFGRTITIPFAMRDLVKPINAQTTSATQGTLLAAQGSGVYADLLNLLITTESATACTVSLTDGTNTYKINIANQQGAGVSWPPQGMVPASSTNTAWQVTGCASVTLDYNAVFVLDK
jgi:hypothetical protein